MIIIAPLFEKCFHFYSKIWAISFKKLFLSLETTVIVLIFILFKFKTLTENISLLSQQLEDFDQYSCGSKMFQKWNTLLTQHSFLFFFCDIAKSKQIKSKICKSFAGVLRELTRYLGQNSVVIPCATLHKPCKISN